MRQDLHRESRVAGPRNQRTDPPESHDPDRLSAQIPRTIPVTYRKIPLPHLAVHKKQLLEKRQHQRQGVFGDRCGIDADAGGHDDSFFGRGRKVNVVHPGAGARNRHQIVRIRKKFPRNPDACPKDDRLHPFHQRSHDFRLRLTRRNPVHAVFFKNADRLGFNRLRKKNLHRCCHTLFLIYLR